MTNKRLVQQLAYNYFTLRMYALFGYDDITKTREYLNYIIADNADNANLAKYQLCIAKYAADFDKYQLLNKVLKLRTALYGND